MILLLSHRGFELVYKIWWGGLCFTYIVLPIFFLYKSPPLSLSLCPSSYFLETSSSSYLSLIFDGTVSSLIRRYWPLSRQASSPLPLRLFLLRIRRHRCPQILWRSFPLRLGLQSRPWWCGRVRVSGKDINDWRHLPFVQRRSPHTLCVELTCLCSSPANSLPRPPCSTLLQVSILNFSKIQTWVFIKFQSFSLFLCYYALF